MSSTDHPADIVVSTFAERPTYVDRVYEMADGWPTFLLHDRVANALLGQVVSTFPELSVIATLDDDPVARGLALPFAQHTERRRGVLTPGGWDEVMLQGFADHRRGTPPDTVSALEIAITPGQRGRGLSARMVGALRDAAAAQGFRELVAPIRPTEKHRVAGVDRAALRPVGRGCWCRRRSTPSSARSSTTTRCTSSRTSGCATHSDAAPTPVL